MAQAAVMPRQQQEQAALRTPGKPPLSPQLDNSLITSTVRKRKGAPAAAAAAAVPPLCRLLLGGQAPSPAACVLPRSLTASPTALPRPQATPLSWRSS